MLRLFSLSLLALLAMSTTPPANRPHQAVSLTVQVSGLKPSKGHLMVALYDSEASFLEKTLQEKRVKVGGSESMSVTFQVPAGTYAVAVYQDVSGNEALDKGLFGVPVEPYGFSNNPPFGRPSFEKSKFSLRVDKTILVRLR